MGNRARMVPSDATPSWRRGPRASVARPRPVTAAIALDARHRDRERPGCVARPPIFRGRRSCSLHGRGGKLLRGVRHLRAALRVVGASLAARSRASALRAARRPGQALFARLAPGRRGPASERAGGSSASRAALLASRSPRTRRYSPAPSSAGAATTHSGQAVPASAVVSRPIAPIAVPPANSWLPSRRSRSPGSFGGRRCGRGAWAMARGDCSAGRASGQLGAPLHRTRRTFVGFDGPAAVGCARARRGAIASRDSFRFPFPGAARAAPAVEPSIGPSEQSGTDALKFLRTTRAVLGIERGAFASRLEPVLLSLGGAPLRHPGVGEGAVCIEVVREGRRPRRLSPFRGPVAAKPMARTTFELEEEER